jgi:hypothetical protein
MDKKKGYQIIKEWERDYFNYEAIDEATKISKGDIE